MTGGGGGGEPRRVAGRRHGMGEVPHPLPPASLFMCAGITEDGEKAVPSKRRREAVVFVF